MCHILDSYEIKKNADFLVNFLPGMEIPGEVKFRCKYKHGFSPYTPHGIGLVVPCIIDSPCLEQGLFAPAGLIPGNNVPFIGIIFIECSGIRHTQFQFIDCTQFNVIKLQSGKPVQSILDDIPYKICPDP